MIEKEKVWYVRMDEKARAEVMSKELFRAHIDYLSEVATQRPFAGGGFKDAPGGMILFTADSLDEAHKICTNDPIILEGYYRYDLKEWEVVLVSDRN